MTILYAYLIAGALFVVATYRMRLVAFRKQIRLQPHLWRWVVAGGVAGVALGVVIWPLVVIALVLDPSNDDEDEHYA